MLVVLVLLATVLMRVAIITAVAYLLLPLGPICPHCGADMAAIRNRFFDRLLSALQRRWGVGRGWKRAGTRVPPAPTRPPAARPLIPSFSSAPAAPSKIHAPTRSLNPNNSSAT